MATSMNLYLEAFVDIRAGIHTYLIRVLINVTQICMLGRLYCANKRNPDLHLFGLFCTYKRNPDLHVFGLFCTYKRNPDLRVFGLC